MRIVLHALAFAWVVFVAGAVPAAAQPGLSLADLGLDLGFGDEEFVSIATGRRQAVAAAPAVATVLTRDDLTAMGVLTLEEALETVPGLHASISAAGYGPIYLFRGIRTRFNPQVLLLVDGEPVTHAYVGDRGQVWGRMPVAAIERIEIIRGPGSALYGADAFAGVIHVHTVSAAEDGRDGVSLWAGGFDTRYAALGEGFQVGAWRGRLSLEYLESDGTRERIARDAQSLFDELLGTNASQAPGRVRLDGRSQELRLVLERPHWRLRAGFQGREDVGTGAGAAQALDPFGEGRARRVTLQAGYDSERRWAAGRLRVDASVFDVEHQTRLWLFPPDSVLPVGADGNIGTPGGGLVWFTDGVIGAPGVAENHRRLRAQWVYEGGRHVVTLGAGGEQLELTASERKNFGPGILDGSEAVVDGRLTVVTGTPYVFLPDVERRLAYAYLQDEWNLAPDWDLTAGLRYDRYSDFGDTVNPRLALVWQATHAGTVKLLYGRAFRAPSFVELYNMNNPVVVGNPDLEPETIDTLELAYHHVAPDGRWQGSVNAFGYRMRDVIRFVQDPPPAFTQTAQNAGRIDGHGLEAEVSWRVSESWRLRANVAWQNSEDAFTGAQVADAPGWQFYLRFDGRFASGVELDVQLNHVADRRRAPDDPRPPVPDYSDVDLALRKPLSGGLTLIVSIQNLFDRRQLEPSPAPGQIPGDLPLHGRWLRVGIDKRW
ncbi:MAG: hypothetical protein KatS3mg121_1370 [Gammaproteobacteria bacterium]|nr:MAG: hypothetical protein KatS3mg121_1370 [Gammaproteobacteria bacterium]